MNFYPSNHSIKIWKSIGILTHKVGVHLGMCGLIPSHSFALLGMWMRPPGCTFNPHLSMLCLDHEPKIRVMTFLNLSIIFLSFFSTSFYIQLGLPHPSIACISWCVCTHPINFMGIHLLHCVHDNKHIGTHDVIHNTLAPLRKMLTSAWDNNNYMHFFQSHPTPFIDELTLCLAKMAFAP